MKKYDLIGIGNAPVDAIIYTDHQFLSKHNLEEGAHRTLHSQAELDAILKDVKPEEMSVMFGGGSANVCSIIGALGGSVGFQGCVGNDDYGQKFIESLKKQNVEHHHIFKDGEKGTMFLVIPITKGGERSFAACYGATGALGPQHITTNQIKQAKGIYIEGFSLVSETAIDAYQKAIEVVRANNGKVFFALSDKSMILNYRSQIDALIGQADIVFMNRMEAETLTGKKDMDDILKALLKMKISGVVTRGSDGVYLLFADEMKAEFFAVETPLSEEEVVNMNGAGDSFAGGYIYGLMHDMAIDDAVKLGCACAREVILSPSARPEKQLSFLLEK